MTSLVAISLGPVASFIAGGRRSRDLWYGSRFLSEATRYAALALEQQGVDLILPRSDRITESYVTLQHERPTITNKIVGRVPSGVDVISALDAAETAARQFLIDELRGLLTDPRTRPLVVAPSVEAQAEAARQGDLLEFYAAWIPHTDDLHTDFPRVMQLLAARKQTRLFGAPASTPRVGKSALDAGRDSVLIEVDAATRPHEARWIDVLQAHAFIRPGERLDALALARRRAAFQVPGAELAGLTFPSLARVAIDPWITGAARAASAQLRVVMGELAELKRQRRGAVSPLYLVTTPVRNPSGGSDFPYDPEVLQENAIPALLRATSEDARRGRPSAVPHGAPPADFERQGRAANWVFEAARAALERLAGPVRELHAMVGVPLPYVALLEADGDGVGDLVKNQIRFDNAEAIAQALYAFADQAWPIIARYSGCAFYSGGDELAAYLPVDRAIEAAAALAREFASQLADKNIHGGSSLSVGIVVGHLKDDLRDLRRQAHAALDQAKQQRRRDGGAESYLAVVEQPRAGTSRMVVGPMSRLAPAHHQWRALLADELPLALVHDLDVLAGRFGAEPRSGDRGGTLGIELARRLVEAKARRGGRAPLSELDERAAGWNDWQDVRHFSAEIRVAERARRVALQRGAS